MTNFIIEKFYQFFEGFMIFQVLFFGMIFFITKRKDTLLYMMLNFITASYFFLNAPNTFMGVDENIVFNSPFYLYINFAILLCMQFTYLVFLKEIFIDTVNQYPYLKKIYKLTICSIIVLYVLFVLFGLSGWHTQYIFYLGHMPNALFATIIVMLNLKVKGYKSLMIYATIITFICVTLTLIFTIRYNAGYNSVFLDKYPLFPVRIGMLIDVILFQLTLLKRWNEQTKQLAIEKIQSELKIEKLRNKISSELHDDLGGSLSGIQMHSYLAKDLIQANSFAKADNSLTLIQQSANGLIERLKDIVWSVKPRADNLQDLFLKTEGYGNEICIPSNIDFKAKFDEKLEGTLIPMDVCYHLYLFCKEAINNAVKYSNASIIEFRISLDNHHLIINISDNGRGFDMNNIVQGNGLSNMQKRAAEINAHFSINTKPNQGCQICLNLNITQ